MNKNEQRAQLFHKEARAQVERNALQAILPLFVAVYAVAFAVYFFIGRGDNIISSYEVTIGVTATATLTALIAIFITFWRREVHASAEINNGALRPQDWVFSGAVIAIGYAVAVGIISFVVMSAVGEAFKGLQYIPLVAAVWPALVAAFFCYWGVRVGAFAKMTNVMRLVALYLISGVLISGIANPNPDWWKVSISYLGMHELASASVFNVAMMLAAALFLASAIFTFPTFSLAHQRELISSRSLKFIRFVFIWAPCGLFLVGACPYGSSALNTFLHNFGAYTMFFFMGLTMLLARRLMPFLSGPFLRVNYALFAGLILMGVFWLLGSLTLALFEALGIAIIAVWLMLVLTAFENKLTETTPAPAAASK